MIKFTRGSIGDKNGVMHDIVVKAAAPNKCRDALIGGGMVLAGIVYLTYTAFVNGAKQFEKAELYAMKDAGVIDCDPEDLISD